jgi:pimeloyl-ACP methyl ester carboxylesterase
LFGIMVLVNITAFTVNAVLSRGELDGIEPYGELVYVNGSKMHVYSMGNGEDTIVLLPGLGVALPSADFGPLMRKLSDHYTVVTIEYFGVGFSAEIDTPRTNENYVHEVRTALGEAGLRPPYVLMPHSASGVYSEYYAAMYPDEVSAIIMLDTTSTALISDDQTPGFIYPLAKLGQAAGNLRFLANLLPETKLIENGYTDVEIADYRRFSFHAINNTMQNQAKTITENVRDVNSIPFPSDIPVLKIISTETIEVMAKQDKDDGLGYQMDHLNRLGANASYKILDASHFLYQTEIDEIVTLTNDFLTIPE